MESAIGGVHYSFLETSQSITAKVYHSQHPEIHAHLQKVGPALVNLRSPLLLHDNTEPFVASIMLRGFAHLRYDETLPSPPYSLDLSPGNYHYLRI